MTHWKQVFEGPVAAGAPGAVDKMLQALEAAGIERRDGPRDNATDCEVHQFYRAVDGAEFEFHSSWYDDDKIQQLWAWAESKGANA